MILKYFIISPTMKYNVNKYNSPSLPNINMFYDNILKGIHLVNKAVR